MIKKTYITIVNETYLPFLDQLIRSHQLFSRIDLNVFTVNFKFLGPTYEGIKFIEYIDENLEEYLNTGCNKFIKEEYQRHKYTTLLKPKILKKFLDSYDYFFFIDSDILFTKNSDILFLNSINEFGETEIPIAVKFFHQYSNHGTGENVFNEDGSFNQKSLTYFHLVEFFGIELNIIDYVTTYCLYYTRECFDFFGEVESICFDENIIRDCDQYLPLGDETVFNYLYSKYDFRKFISSFLCYDVPHYFEISRVLENLGRLKEIVSFIHTKRFLNNFSFEKLLVIKEDEYESIFKILKSSSLEIPEGKVFSFEQNHSTGADTIFFNCGENLIGYSKIDLASLFRPGKEFFYYIDSITGVIYYVVKEHDKITKDLYLISSIDRNIKEVLKIT